MYDKNSTSNLNIKNRIYIYYNIFRGLVERESDENLLLWLVDKIVLSLGTTCLHQPIPCMCKQADTVSEVYIDEIEI